MDSEARAPGREEESRGGIFLFAAAGIGIYVALKILEPSIAFPLRQFSSVLATWFLNALSIPSTLEGTAISTGTFSFDVNPDCSGSTSLRIMLTLGALWFGMYPNLTLGRRLLCLALAAPIAVFFNAVRVTALVFMGDSIGEPVEGFPHELVGIVSFLLAMGAVYLMTLLMAKEPEVVRRIGPRAHGVLLILAIGICYAPVLAGSVMNAPTWGVALVNSTVVVLGLLLLFLVKGPAETHRPAPAWVPLAGFAFSLAAFAYGTITDVITLSSLSLLGVLFSVVLYLRGWSSAWRSLPLLGAIFLGLPGLHFFRIAGRVGGSDEEGYGLVLVVVGLMAAALIGTFLYLSARSDAQDSSARRGISLLPKLGTVPAKVFILCAFVGILFQTYFNSQAAAFDKIFSLKIPRELGEWYGRDLELSPNELEVVGRERIVSREYRRAGSDPIRLLASSTGADRRRAHRPEHCMTTLGWEVAEEEIMTHEGPAGETPMTRLQLRRNSGERMEMRYWLADPEGEVYGNIAALQRVDVTRRLTGRRTDWQIFRVFAMPGSPAIGDFLDELLSTQLPESKERGNLKADQTAAAD